MGKPRMKKQRRPPMPEAPPAEGVPDKPPTAEKAKVVEHKTDLAIFASPGEVVDYRKLNTSVAGQEHIREGDEGVPPRLHLVQKENRPIDGAIPGKIMLTSTGDQYDEVMFVPLMFRPWGFLRWPEDYNVENDPECYSDDGFMPAIPTENRPMTDRLDGPCCTPGGQIVCPMAEFTDHPAVPGKKIAPRCGYRRNFLVTHVDPATEQITACTLTFKSTALKVVRQTLHDLFIGAGQRRVIHYTTRSYTDAGGRTYFLPVFWGGEMLSETAARHMVALREEQERLYEAGLLRDETDLRRDPDDTIEPGAPAGQDEMEDIPF